MGRFTPLRWLTLALAALHTLPTWHHLGDFFERPSLADGWKGFGALGAIALLLLPQRLQARIALALWKRRAAGALVAFAIALAHVVPASDHLPKLLASATFGDAWKGLGALVAIAWFLAPRVVQLGVVRKLAHTPSRGTMLGLAATLVAAFVAACSGGHTGFDEDAGTDSGTKPSDSGGPLPSGDSGFVTGDGSTGTDAGGPAIIYAHTDTELYSLDPTSQAITDIGPFSVGSGTLPPITDLAVDGNGSVWVNSESTIYRAAVPQSPGPVVLTLVSPITLKTNQKFYALGFAPAGVLGTNETLVAGDNAGALYAIETNGTTTDLGTFGTDTKGNAYELSGDVVFYEQNSKPRGLATIRSCPSGSCSTTNDLLAEIDVAAMSTAYQTKTPGNLRKQLIGTGTGFGRLFGVGAWDSNVYAFSRSASSTPAQLIQINSTGAGTSIKTFSQITAGWSGAGVTTKAPVTVLPPN